MKKIFFFILLAGSLSVLEESHAQQTIAYDFNMNDCSGNMHHLFAELDSGNVAIMEFFMLSCSPCVDAGNELEPMFQNLKASCSSKILFYHFGFTNSYTCSQVTNWVSTNLYSSIPFDSGGVQVAYYGGMGMPTMAVVAGNTHKVLHTSVGYVAGDTAIIADSIRTFFGCASAGVHDFSLANSVSVYPNPSNGKFQVSCPKSQVSTLEIFNVMGEKFYSSTQSEIDISSQPNGIYFLRGKTSEGIFSRKIIVQK